MGIGLSPRLARDPSALPPFRKFISAFALEGYAHLGAKDKAIGDAVGSSWIDDPLKVRLDEREFRELDLVIPFEDELVVRISIARLRDGAGVVAAEFTIDDPKAGVVATRESWQ